VTDSECPADGAAYQQALLRHVQEHGYSGVEFIETTDPENDLDVDDYIVAYEAVFRPKDLEHAHLEIWVTDDGYVGIMFEKRARIAERLGARLWTMKEACAAGREPSAIPVGELIAFVRLVAEGNVFVKARRGIFELGSIKAIVSKQAFASLRSSNPRKWDWLLVKTDDQIARMAAKLITFQPW
jgi:hypothetical protein